MRLLEDLLKEVLLGDEDRLRCMHARMIDLVFLILQRRKLLKTLNRVHSNLNMTELGPEVNLGSPLVTGAVLGLV